MSAGAKPSAGPLSREIGNILMGWSARRGLSQTALASRIGVSQSQLSKLLRGIRPLDIDQIDRICTVLEIDILTVMKEARTALA